MVVATYLLYPALARVVPRIATDTAQLYAAFRAPSLVVASVALVPVIVGEELVWRGVVQASLVERLGAWRGVALAAVVYALVHAPLGSPVLVVVAFFCGLAWGALRAKTASLVPSPGGSPGVGRARPALAATGHQMKRTYARAKRVQASLAEL